MKIEIDQLNMSRIIKLKLMKFVQQNLFNYWNKCKSISNEASTINVIPLQLNCIWHINILKILTLTESREKIENVELQKRTNTIVRLICINFAFLILFSKLSLLYSFNFFFCFPAQSHFKLKLRNRNLNELKSKFGLNILSNCQPSEMQ